ncbi:MAG: metallophosphoesterase [Synergistales bacterium]|nr:metallophosphoesterase [Synergistales bacterium]
MDIVLDLDDSTWFSSDQHFGHKSIIAYDRRPFRDLEEMHASLIKRHNDSVPARGSTVIFLGDYVHSKGDNPVDLAGLTRSLHGERIILLMGNHDRFPIQEYKRVFDEVIPEGVPVDIRWNYRSATLIHSPLEILKSLTPKIEDRSEGYGLAALAMEINKLNIEGSWICGHVHTIFRKIGPVVNVGVDAWDYCPVNISKVFELLDDPALIIHGRKGYEIFLG